MDPYWILFENNLLSHLPFAPEKPFAFQVMQRFGGYDPVQMLFITVAGALSAFAFSYGVGNAVSVMLSQWFGRFDALRERSLKKSRNYLLFGLLFSYAPLLGALLPFFAGSLRLSLPISMALFCLSIFSYHLYLSIH
jgi:membrane protein YqaA with SNARE-associated domain